MTTIDELLKSLQIVSSEEKKELTNNLFNWTRIGEKDSFDELGLSKTELQEFLSEWISENPYSNI